MKQLFLLVFFLYNAGAAYARLQDGGTATPFICQEIAFKKVNEAPVVNAGMDAIVFEGDTVVLNGSLSYDPDSDNISYQWVAPAGITVNNTSIANPSFIAPKVSFDTTYVFSLVVNDGTMDSNIDKVLVTVRKINHAPVAIAGADVEKFEGDTTTLDGSKSYDQENNTLTYIWTTLNGETLSASENSKIPFTIPRYLRDTVLVISLVVNDGSLNSLKDDFSITVWHINIAPVADAGKNFEIDEGMTTSLNGSLSYDPEKRPLVYQWIAPHGITLSSASDQKPIFTSPEVSKDTTYCFTLIVSDGLLESEPKQVKVTVRQVNKASKANAGGDFFINEGTLVTLNGSLSSDEDGDPLTYQWIVPRGITINSSVIPGPTFVAPEVSRDTTYLLSLVVNDGKTVSPACQVAITVRQVNKAPVANAGIDFWVNEGAIATLDGSLSSDKDGDPLTYQWVAPNGIVLDSIVAVNPTFTAPEVYQDTTFTIALVVNDGKTDSSPHTVSVMIKNIVKPTFFKVYPNPSLGFVTVEYSRTPEKQAQAFISTISGKVIWRKEITGRSHFHLDLSGNTSGVYILTILEDGNVYNQPIILNKK